MDINIEQAILLKEYKFNILELVDEITRQKNMIEQLIERLREYEEPIGKEAQNESEEPTE